MTKKKKSTKKKKMVTPARRGKKTAMRKKATKSTTRKKKSTKPARRTGGKTTQKKSATKKRKKTSSPRKKQAKTRPASQRKATKKRTSSRRTSTKKDDMVLMDMLLNSSTRARMLRLLFREPTVSFPHKDIAQLTGVSLPKVRREAKALAEMDIVTNRSSGGKMRVKVNTAFPFVEELKRMATASFPIGRDSLVKMLKPAGNVKLIIVAGTLMNDPKARVDLLVVADRYSEKRLERAVKKVEQAAAAELRWAGMPTKEFKYRWKMFDRFLHDVVSGPHEKLVEKVKVKK